MFAACHKRLQADNMAVLLRFAVKVRQFLLTFVGNRLRIGGQLGIW